MQDYPRLIEHAFPLRQASLDSVHEKAVRHGHISTLHLWPARRPLAAARAALLATLLPDPGTPDARKELCEKIGGKVKQITEKGKLKEITVGGVLHWKREEENEDLLESLRQDILSANGGRAPKFLDPFAGGGAIPLEAMRLNCEVTSSDLNPVAWFIQKCTLEYPQKLAGFQQPLPAFILRDRNFMEDFLIKVRGMKKDSAKLRKTLEALGHLSEHGDVIQDELDFEGAVASSGISLDADLAWHVKAWGRWVLADARKKLSRFYPTYAEWHPLEPGHPFEPESLRLIEPDQNGIANSDKLNSDFSDEYLKNKRNPRWVTKQTVAYLWARTVTCKNCRALFPLLKTRWLCKRGEKRIRLLMEPNSERTGVIFGIEENVPARGGNAAQVRENDKKFGAGTMSRSGACCPCCESIMTTEDIRYEGRNGRLGQMLTSVAVEGIKGKEYRLPTPLEQRVAEIEEEVVQSAFEDLPYGVPSEPTPKCGAGASRAFSVDPYGFDQWRKLFTNRQLIALCEIIKSLRAADISGSSIFDQAVRAILCCAIDRSADYNSTITHWQSKGEFIVNTFQRFALSISWDFSETSILSGLTGSFEGAVNWVALFQSHAIKATSSSPSPKILIRDAASPIEKDYDIIVTDPPYYDAIPYSDLMDFFYVWLRRSLTGIDKEFDAAFSEPLAPKWNHEAQAGELIDDAARHSGDKTASKKAYEDGMARAFQASHAALAEHGRFVVVFAHKHPDAWETLVSAIIRAGFLVDGSWPIATEMANRTRALSSAALASSVWLVCRKRDPAAKAGWDNRVMAEMRANIAGQLREFWDAGIRGPDFVWAATGPAMEAYSKYPAVKKANSPSGEMLKVGEFLESVRRMVIEYVVGRVLHVEAEATDRLDSVTSYYLLHRNDFAFEKAPAGACILYAVSCGLSDAELERTWNLVKVKGSKIKADQDDDSGQSDGGDDEGGGGEFTLRTWKERKEKRMGYEAPGGREVPLIDRVHRVMHLWKEGDVRKVDDYLDDHALRRNELFVRVIQSLIELSDRSGDERPLLESLSNHLGVQAAKVDTTMPLKLDTED